METSKRYDKIKNGVKTVKDEITWKAAEDRKKFVDDFYNQIHSLSNREKRFLIDLIQTGLDEGWDFSPTRTIAENFPENQEKLTYIFRILSTNGVVEFDNQLRGVLIDIQDIQKTLEEDIESSQLIEQKSEEKVKNQGEVQALKDQL